MACPLPLMGPSGATTQTSPKSLAISVKTLMPGAEILSSFVMRIRGFFVIFIWLYAKVTWIRAAAHVLVYVYNENFITTLCSESSSYLSLSASSFSNA